MKGIVRLVAGLGMIIALAGCSTWNNMDRQEKGMVSGAGVGAVAGALIDDGNVLGTVGGAAIGGFIGNEIGKDRR